MCDILHLNALENKVYWRVIYSEQQSSTTFGAFEVDSSSGKHLNEYLVAWHLLVDLAILGANRFGTNLKVVFSQSSSKKLFNGDVVIDDDQAMAAVIAFRVRFADARVDVNHRINTFDTNVPTPILPVITPEVKAYNESCLAFVNVTFHALARWKERSDTKTYAKALKTLLETTQKNVFHEIKLNDRIAYNKKMKYEREATHYSVNIYQGIRFVCVDRPQGEKTLLTVYFAPADEAA